MPDDYHLLGLGGLTSLITDVKVSSWGNEIVFECLYNPEDPSLYLMVFKDCREMRWDVHDSEEVQDPLADLIGFHLGKDNQREPALIYTDIFEISLLYGSFTMANSRPRNAGNSSARVSRNFKSSRGTKQRYRLSKCSRDRIAKPRQ